MTDWSSTAVDGSEYAMELIQLYRIVVDLRLLVVVVYKYMISESGKQRHREASRKNALRLHEEAEKRFI